MIADIYELSPIQAGMLFHRVFAPESAAYFDQFSCQLSGRVDANLLRQAWQQLVDRHDVLRTSFHWEGLDKPVQVVHQQVTLPFASHDWRDLPVEERRTRWAAFLERDRADGFQPDAAPLMRCCLARIADDRCYFCWSHHHLLLDGWCLTLVLSELFAHYDSLARGQAPRLHPVRPYREYIRWLQQRDAQAVANYWRETLRGFTAATPLPAIETAAPAASGSANATAETHLSEALTAQLRALVAGRHLTLNTLMQGAWALLLSRYSGEQDVVFGTTVSGRPPEVSGIETMLGVFINTVPVRLQVDPGARAGAWLAQIQSQHVVRESFAAIALSDIQKVSDLDAGTPLFDSNLIVMNYRLDEGLAHGGAGIEVRDVQTFDLTDTPLTLQVTPGPRLSLEIAYDDRRFDAGTIRRVLGHLEHLLAEFQADLDRPLSAFDILTEGERVELLTTFNDTAAPLDPEMTIVDLWEQRAAATPDAIALGCEETRLSFRELNEQANRLARGLLRLAPIGKDDLVAVAFRRSHWTVAAILAIWKCGAAYVPVDPDYPDDRIRGVLEDGAPRIVLREAGTFGGRLEIELAPRTRFASIADLVEASQEERAANLGRRIVGADLAYAIFTSGSTGRPKGAMVEHLGLANHMLAKLDTLQLDGATVVVQNASHCFDVSVWQFFTAMLAGGRTIIYGDDLVLDPERFLARVESDRVTVLEVVPSYLSALLDRLDEAPRALRDLKYLLVTGEMVKPALLARWFASYPAIPAVNAYGPTEAADDVTQAVMHELPPLPTVPVGRPLRNFHIYIVTEQMNLCPVGIKGEICVSGAGVGRGYLNDPARTAAVFVEDPFRAERGVRMYRTGDVGCFMPDGTVLMFGRRDHQVKVRGYRIELGDIEAAIASLDGIRDAAVVDRRDRAEGTYLAAYVTLRDGASADSEQILERLADKLPEFMIPATCTILQEMPLTSNGKVDRKRLPAPDLTMRPRGTVYAAPRTPVEQLFADIWKEVLGVERPGIHDNFFALGGDSIVSMQIASRASRAGLALTPRHVFQHQTIAELAEAAGTLGRPSEPVAAPRPPGPTPLVPAQEQFFLDVTVDRDHYNQSILLDVPAGFDPAGLKQALDAIVQHHVALRLRFAEADGRWQQRVSETEDAPIVSVHDLSRLSRTDRAAALAEIGGRLHASLNIADGPVLCAACFDRGADEPDRLLLIVHHLAIDGVSWRILLEDLALAYDQIGRGEPIALPRTATSFLQWADTLAAFGASDDIAGDLEYWTAGARASVPALPIHAGGAVAANTVGDGRDVEVVIDAKTTAALLTETAQAYQTGVTDLLLAAVGLAAADALECPRLLVDLETHGREHAFDRIDLTRTVGWFTSTFPVLVDASGVGSPGELVREVKERLRAVPNRGLSYGILRHRARAAVGPSPISTMPSASVALNYHGRVDQDPGSGWRLSFDPHGASRSSRQAREYALEINGFVAAQQLRLTITYSPHLHSEATARRFAQALRNAVAALVDEGGREQPGRWTPSDFPDGRLDQASLDALAARVRDVEDVYELSPTQHGMLFHALFAPASDVYFNQLTCVLTGALDVAAFQEAWRAVTDRHGALRTSFHWKDLARPVQVVHARVETPWIIDDWSALASDAQARLWRRQLDEDRHRPFDLSAPPLMRFGLCRVAAGTSWFRWSQHHLQLDGWSSSIVLSEVVSAYDALTRGAIDAPPAPRPFRDHVVWLRRQNAGEAERFWRGQLDGFTTPTPLVLGVPALEGRVEPARVAEAEMTLPDEVGASLRSLCAHHQITLNTLFQGVWSVLLSHHSGEADVVFGAIVSGRPPALDGSDQMVGLFINTIPVRVRTDPSAPLVQWLRDLQRANGERDAYAYCSLADVQRWSQVEAGTALFETILIFENYPVADALAQGGRSLEISQVQAFEPNNFPMTFVVTPGARIGIKIMFDEGRFDRATIERTLTHLRTLLAGVVERPTRTVGSLPMVTGEERREILESWNRTAKPIPADRTVVELIEAQAAAAPGKDAVHCDGRSVTYAALDARANQLARVLLASGRIGHETCVALLLRRSERLLETILALWKCGAVYVPVDPEYPDERIATIIRGSRAALVITDRAGLGAGSVDRIAAHAPVLVLEDIEAARSAQEASALRLSLPPDRLAYTIFTSGSTGVPKGAMVEHVGMMNHILSMVDELALGPTSIVAQTASHCFDISMWQLFAALVAGGTTAIYAERLVVRPAMLARALASDGVTIVQFVPSYLNVFMDALDGVADRPRFAALSHLVLIGEALTHASVERWFRLYPHVPLMNAYGPTEASDSIAHHDMERAPRGALVPIGTPIQNMALYILDRNMNLCPVGVKGEICVAGIGVGRGYLFDEERTRQVFVPDPFGGAGRMYKTGDVGCYAPDGTILFFGRRDFQVKVRGHRIELGEIESRLAAHDGIRDAAVVSKETAGGDRFLCAYVTLRAGVRLTEEAISAYLAETLPRYAVPDVVRVLPEMPVLSNGKVDRRTLTRKAIERAESRPRAAATTDTERRLTRIWSEVLRRDVVGIDDTFFDLGGHSLKAIEIASRIGRDCGVDVGLAEIFEHNTIRALSRRIETASRTVIEPIPALPAQPHYDTSSTQKRMWLSSRTPEGSSALNMAGAFYLDRDVDMSALRRAFRALVERHESLRTVLLVVAGSLRQRVLSADAVGDIVGDVDWRADRAAAADLAGALRPRVDQPFDLSAGPLIDVQVFRIEERRRVLLVRMHHTIGDALSIRILLNEALELYAAFHAGAPNPLEPLTMQYRDFVAWQNDRAASGRLAASRDYWRRTLSPAMPRAGFTPDRPRTPAQTFSAEAIDCAFDADLSARLRAVAARYGTTRFGVSLAAVFALLYRHTAQEDLVLGTQVSRRSRPQLERQIGCYIDTLVLRGRVRTDDTAGTVIAATARIVRDALEHQDYPFDAVLDDLTVNVPPGRTPLFDVLVNYVPAPPSIAAVATRADLSITELPLDADAAQYDTTFLIGESDEGATMTMKIIVNAELFEAGTVRVMRERLLAVFRWLAEDAESSVDAIDLVAPPATRPRRLHIQLNAE